MGTPLRKGLASLEARVKAEAEEQAQEEQEEAHQ